MKKFVKSEKDKKLCGVCSGIAEYFEIDSLLVRLVFVSLCLIDLCFVFAYFIAAIVMNNPDHGEGS